MTAVIFSMICNTRKVNYVINEKDFADRKALTVAPTGIWPEVNDLNKFLFELVVQFYRGRRLQEHKISQKIGNTNAK